MSLLSALLALSRLPPGPREAALAVLAETDARRLAHDWPLWARDDQLPPAATVAGV